MQETNKIMQQARGMIGARLRHDGQNCTVIEVLEDRLECKRPTAPPTQRPPYPLTRNGNNSSMRLYGQTGNFSIVSFNQA